MNALTPDEGSKNTINLTSISYYICEMTTFYNIFYMYFYFFSDLIGYEL